ncbi:MAG: amidohydrolase [Bacteroidetes bacterium]|jgi:amidohydrolase|nr:amidohydrolase [Bacteroidota bacterium]MBT6684728.1 amidohydrolase [Bacteroidota bacterium]MBT7143829.1 amidohydrolase [Bacteroidota bacterium]MBT7489990.1 amidohydrolase [Bacteroidota bacterium]
MNPQLKTIIKELSDKYFSEIQNIRRHIHSNPELSFEEFETSKYIASKLEEYNIPFISGIANNGIVATIKGKANSNKIVALRADIDALPITEKNDIPFKSKVVGKMHACGHDVHTASLLGAAKILNELKGKFSGIIKLVFQPAEEKAPGGAKAMLEENLFGSEKPNLIIAQHVMPSIDVGKVGFKSGMYMASTDEVFITVKGKGGHAALPHEITDTVLIASHIVVSLQQIVSRHAPASIPSVLSFGRFIADSALNAIPDEVKISGTFRTMDENWRKEAKQKIKTISESIAKGMGGECEVNFIDGYPFLVNDPKITSQAKEFTSDFIGTENIEDMEIRMTGEDFAYFSQEYPATLFRLGTRNIKKNITSPLHSSTFDVDENSLKLGAGIMAWLAVSFLK